MFSKFHPTVDINGKVISMLPQPYIMVEATQMYFCLYAASYSYQLYTTKERTGARIFP